jgi:hypothetical protein
VRGLSRSKEAANGTRDGLGRLAWAHFGPSCGLLRGRCFSCLLECSPFCMWALSVSFSAVWIEFLVSQDSAFSVQVLRVFRLHGLVLRLLGVLFTTLLDLCRASWSSHEVLDELYSEVLHLTLNSCIIIKLQDRHARTNLLYQGG